jgi:branched-chain amino acid transport system permease protein
VSKSTAGTALTAASSHQFATPYGLPRLVKSGGITILLVFLAVCPVIFPNPTVTTIGVFTMMFLIAVVGWNIFSGYTGYISLGHAAFFGIGQYTVAEIATHAHMPGGWDLFTLLPVAGITAAVIAVPLGALLLRVRRHTFIVLTIAVMFIGQLLAFNWHDFTNGAVGLTVPAPPWQGTQFNQIFYYVALCCALVTIAASVFIRRSKYGLSLLAIRDDEDRARGLGVRTMPAKLTAFVISAFFTGIAGAIYATFVGFVYPQFAFDPTFDLALVVLAFVGGLGTITGPILACLLLVPVQQYLQLQFGASNVYLLVYGILFLLILRFLPAGIVPTMSQAWRHRVARNRESSPPPGSASGLAPPPVSAVATDHGGTQ